MLNLLDLVNKFLSVYLAWLWFQVIVILLGIGGMVLFALSLSN